MCHTPRVKKKQQPFYVRTRPCVEQSIMLTLIEEARVRIETFLGWAMLLHYSLCCKSPVTLVTQRQLAVLLRQERTLDAAVGWSNVARYVQLFVRERLRTLRNLANRPAATIFPVISRRAGGFLGAEPLRRVRVEHITPWSKTPNGRLHHCSDLQAAFRTRGFDLVAEWTEADGNVAFQCWRQVTNRPLTEEVYAELTTTTARLVWSGFHCELVEQTMEWHATSDVERSPSSVSTSRSRSSGRQLRRQHAGLENS